MRVQAVLLAGAATIRKDGWALAGSASEIASGVAISNSSAGKEAVKLAKTLSSCSGVMAARRMRSPLPGGAEGGVTPGIESAVAIVIRETDGFLAISMEFCKRPDNKAIGGFLQSPIDQPPGQSHLNR